MRLNFRVAIISVFVLFLFSVLFVLARSPARGKVVIADARQPNFALIYVADKMGFFRRHGLEVAYRKFDLGKDALTDVLEGNSDLATVYDAPVLWRIAEGADIKILTTLHFSTRNSALIARKSLGIRDISDIRGRKIAFPFGTNVEYYFDLLVRTEGISKSEISVENMSGADCVKALKEGRIDAAVLFNPFLTEAIKDLKEDGAVFYSDAYRETSMLVGSRFVRPENRDNIIRLLRAMDEAEEFIIKNRSGTLEIIGKWLPHYGKDTVISTWDFSVHRVSLDHKLVNALELQSEFYYGDDPKNPVPKIMSHIASEYLREANPEKVTVNK